MSDKEVLERAIQKAIDGGWKHPSMVDDRAGAEVFVYADSSMVNFGYHLNNRIYYIGGNVEPTNNIIFNHDFAKALWNAEPTGEYRVSEDGKRQYMTIEDQNLWDGVTWKEHLKQLALAQDRIKYLAENMP